MPSVSVLLLLAAAFCHAAWNLVAKRTSGSRHWIFTYAMLAGAIALSPALFVAKLPAFCWLLAVLSAVMETVYYLLLAQAYDRYHLSFVYPVGRGSAPLFTALVSLFVFRERLSILGIAGVLTIAAGIAVCTFQPASQGARGLPVAIGIGAAISSYTVIDAVAVRRANPITYTALVFLLGAMFMAALHARREGMASAAAAWRANRRAIVAIGILMVVAYSLVLGAYRVANVAYAAAVREISIPLAAIGGTVILREPFGKARIAGAIIVACGALVVVLAR